MGNSCKFSTNFNFTKSFGVKYFRTEKSIVFKSEISTIFANDFVLFYAIVFAEPTLYANIFNLN